MVCICHSLFNHFSSRGMLGDCVKNLGESSCTSTSSSLGKIAEEFGVEVFILS